MKKVFIAFAFLANLLCFLFVSGCADAQPQTQYTPEIEAKIKQVESALSKSGPSEDSPKWTLEERMKFYKIPGLSIAVIHNYQVEWARGYGWADKTEQRPVTAQTLFQAASISKSLNGVGVLKLAQDGKLDLYADINNYLKTWKFPYDSLSKGKKISIANLLSHTAGLGVHGFPGYNRKDRLPSIPEILDGKKPANTNAVRSLFEPGLKSVYSGGGTTISQLIVMDITKEPYDQYMQKTVLDPMGMTSSFYTQPPPAGKQSLLATGYQEDGTEVSGKFNIYPEEAPAGLWTNPTDLGKYIIETELSYQGKSSKVLNTEFTRLRLKPYMDQTAALGVFVTMNNEVIYFQHGGANNGFRSQYFGSLESGEGVVVMVNSDKGDIMPELINSVANIYQWEDFFKSWAKGGTGKEVKLSTAQLKSVEGKYTFQFEPGRDAFLQITATENGLTLKQMWDEQEIHLVPDSELTFFSKERPFTLKFIKNSKGEITQVLALDRDLWTRVNQ